MNTTDAIATVPTATDRLTIASTTIGAVCLAAAGALQATGLDWTENAVHTPAQHVAMALTAAGLLLTLPGVVALGRRAAGRLGRGAVAVAAGHVAIAAAMTVSNVRGEDAAWFDPVAALFNLVWLAGSVMLAAGLFRGRQVPRPLAVGAAVAYVATIPLSTVGGGIVAGCYWLAVAVLVLSDDAPPAATDAMER
jgi:hypothetical protein